MKNSSVLPYLNILAVLGGFLATYIAVSSQFVRADAFQEFKEGTINQIISRLDKIDRKLDRLIEESHK